MFDSSFTNNPYRRNAQNTIKNDCKNIKGFGKFKNVNGNLFEFPIGSLKYVQLPLVYSYMNLIGFGFFKKLKSAFSATIPSVIDFHLVDIDPCLEFLNENDSLLIRSAYYLGSKKQNGIPSLQYLSSIFDNNFTTYTDFLKELELN